MCGAVVRAASTPGGTRVWTNLDLGLSVLRLGASSPSGSAIASNRCASMSQAPLLDVRTTPADWFLHGRLSDVEPPLRMTLREFPAAIGRRPDNALVLTHPGISGRHAILHQAGDHLIVEDLGSTNGTFVNGERVTGTARLGEGDLLQFAMVVLRAGRCFGSVSDGTMIERSDDDALAVLQFDKLLNEKAVVPFFQPIVEPDRTEISKAVTIGYEVLGRSRLFGLQTPAAMFSAAARMNREIELSRLFRIAGLESARMLPPTALFINTHPAELEDVPGLLSHLTQLRGTYPQAQIVLEIHEAAVAAQDEMRTIFEHIRGLDMRLAYDDFGAGQARLQELVDVPPHFLKFDMKLVRGIHLAPAQRQLMLATLVRMTSDLGIIPLAEGIEEADDAETCQQLGFKLIQGFFYGRPAPAQNFTVARASS